MNKIDLIRSKLDPKLEKLPLRRLVNYSYIISSVTLLIGFFSRFILPPEIPLYYGLPQTEEQLAPVSFLILPSVISIFITTLNTLFSIYTESEYLKKVLAVTSISVSILAAIAILKIIYLIGPF